jgi:hypothetical protein
MVVIRRELPRTRCREFGRKAWRNGTTTRILLSGCPSTASMLSDLKLLFISSELSMHPPKRGWRVR